MIVTIHNAKGGCGKTTTAFNLSAQLFKSGHKFLLIDFDKQGDLSRLYLKNPSKYSFYEIISQNIDTEDVIVKADRKDYIPINILPSNEKLQRIYVELQSDTFLQDEFLAKISLLELQHEILLIDCSNNLGILEDLIFKISDLVIIPINPGMNIMYDSVRAIEHIVKAQKSPYSTKNVKYKVLLNSFLRPYSPNEPNEQRQIREYAHKTFEGSIFDTIIREYAIFTRSEIDRLPIPFLMPNDDTYSLLLNEVFLSLGIIFFNKDKKDLINGKN